MTLVVRLVPVERANSEEFLLERCWWAAVVSQGWGDRQGNASIAPAILRRDR